MKCEQAGTGALCLRACESVCVSVCSRALGCAQSSAVGLERKRVGKCRGQEAEGRGDVELIELL